MEILLLVLLLIGLGIMAVAVVWAFLTVDLPLFGKPNPIWDILIPIQRKVKRLLRWKCPYCRDQFQESDSVMNCPNCKTMYHLECGRLAGKCSVFGCATQFNSISNETPNKALQADLRSRP